MGISCPICDKNDRIQKVSGLVQSGRSGGTFEGPTVGGSYGGGKVSVGGAYSVLSGESSTDLAKVLEPPSQMSNPKGLGFWTWGCSLLLFVPWFLGGFHQFFFEGGKDPSYYLGTVAGLIGLIVVYSIHNNKLEKSKSEYQRYQSAWHKAMNKWNRLYYCHRDDIVFDPEINDYSPPTGMNNLIFGS